MNDSVVVTGIGFLTALGDRQDAIVKALKGKNSAVGELTGRDYSSMPVKFGSRIDPAILDSYDLDRIRFKMFKDYVKFGFIATKNALEDAGLLEGETFDERYIESRRGMFVSTGINGENAEGLFDAFARSEGADGGLDLSLFASRGIPIVHPMWILSTLSNNLIYFLTSSFGIKGDNNNVTYASSGGGYMIDAAWDSLQQGQCDVALVTGADSIINWQAIDDLTKSGVLAHDTGVDPVRTMAPYTVFAAGALPGEGAACLVLEREDAARERGATIYARVLGTALASSGTDHLSPRPDGQETAQVLESLIGRAPSKSFFLLNLNGCSIPAWDRAELKGLSRALEFPGGSAAVSRFVCTASKPYFGHTFAASFVIDAAVSALSLHAGFAFGLLESPSVPEARSDFCLDYTNSDHGFAITLGQGFGGNTGGVLFGRV